MNNRIKRLIAATAVACAITAGIGLSVDHLVAVTMDTTWGAPDIDHIISGTPPIEVDTPIITISPYDTTWG